MSDVPFSKILNDYKMVYFDDGLFMSVSHAGVRYAIYAKLNELRNSSILKLNSLNLSQPTCGEVPVGPAGRWGPRGVHDWDERVWAKPDHGVEVEGVAVGTGRERPLATLAQTRPGRSQPRPCRVIDNCIIENFISFVETELRNHRVSRTINRTVKSQKIMNKLKTNFCALKMRKINNINVLCILITKKKIYSSSFEQFINRNFCFYIARWRCSII